MTSSPVRFAAVIPLHDKVAHIARALESVGAQTYPAHEVIVVDDASTDGGRAVVERMARPEITLLTRNRPGPGGYAARNLAIAQARSEWIAFLDADDRWSPDHLEVMARALSAAPDVGAVATRFTHVHRDRREPDRVAPSLAGAAPVRLDLRAFLEAWLTAEDCPTWTGAVAVRRDLALRVGGFPAGRARRGGDKDLWLRLVREADLLFVPVATSDFHHDAQNKLTHAVDTRSIPLVAETARAMIPAAPPPERAPLRRLANQEMKLYARWTAATGGRGPIRMGDLVHPASPSTIGTVLAARWLPASLLRLAYRLEHARRARGRGEARGR